MILVIRISGQVDLSHAISEGLNRINLKRKYAATFLKPTKENLQLLKKLRNFVAFGDVKKEMALEIIKKRGQPIKKETKIDAEKIVSQIETRNLRELGLKPFFRLHPPRGGIDSKKHFGVNKGVLGDNKEKINDLVGRML